MYSPEFLDGLFDSAQLTSQYAFNFIPQILQEVWIVTMMLGDMVIRIDFLPN